MSLRYNANNSYLFVNGKEIFKFKVPNHICTGSISTGFSNTKSREVSLNGNVYDFLVDYSSIDKSDILNIHKCSMTKSKIK